MRRRNGCRSRALDAEASPSDAAPTKERRTVVSPQAVTLISALVLVVAGIAFDVYCLKDIARADVVLYFPAQVWFYLIIFSTPFGGIAYLKLGRPR